MTTSETSLLPGDDEIEAGRLLFAKECTFLIGAVSLNDLPDNGLPEVAFAGRSNVGKSSLINALTNRKTLARTSNTPGRTQQLNFFDLGGRLTLADLPGYGYARAPKESVREWTELIGRYLQGRVPLKRTCLLIDARHGIKTIDSDVMKMLDKAAVSYLIVLTKSDKISAGELARVQAETTHQMAAHIAAYPMLITTSSAKGDGIETLRAALAALALAS